MFGSLPRSTTMDMDGNGLPLTNEDAEFEANWSIMNEIRRELELEQLEGIPDEEPIYIPSIDEFNRTQCPICSNDSLFQFSSQHPITCRQCSFQYQMKNGSLNEIHAYHRQVMGHCQETKLHSTLWNNEDGTTPSLLLICTKCDFNFCV
jgi:ribosomal protein S27E